MTQDRAESLLGLTELSKTFVTKGSPPTEVLRDLYLDCPAGQFTSIVGASGCGKSTLLRIVNGLIAPTSGEVRVAGEAVRAPDAEMSFVFQQDNLLPWQTVRRNVEFGLTLRRVEKGMRRARSDELLQTVGLSAFGEHYPHELSGGMRQRVNLARALAVDPTLLLMDEPFAALDAQTREIMQAELLQVWDATEKTVLFVTHQVDEAVYLSDRVLVFTVRPGRIKADIAIDLPRPRDLHIKRSPEFTGYCDQIWSLIESEVRESMNLELLNVGGRMA